MSVDILFFIALLNLVVWLVVSYNSWGKLFPLHILICILKFTTVWFLAAAFSLFNRESDSLTRTLYCIQPFVHSHKSFDVTWKNSKTVYFYFSVLSGPPTTPWNAFCWITFRSASKKILFTEINCNYIVNTDLNQFKSVIVLKICII